VADIHQRAAVWLAHGHHLGFACAATAVINFLIPQVDTLAGDTPTAVKMIEGLTAFLLWVIVVLSTLTLFGISLLEIYARIVGALLRLHTNGTPAAESVRDALTALGLQ